MAEEYKTCCPNEYYANFIKEKIRPDGRKFDAIREMIIEQNAIPSCDGSALIKLGSTIIYCGIKGELALMSDCVNESQFIVLNFDYSPILRSEFRFGFPSENTQDINQYLNNIFDTYSLIDQNSLIVNEKVRWVLYVDLICCGCDGSLLDASVAAINAAFQNLKLPLIRVKEDVEVVRNQFYVPTLKSGVPLALTFIQFDGNWIIDPTDEEERVGEGICQFAVDDQNIIWLRVSGGATSISMSEINHLLEIGLKIKQKTVNKTSELR